MKAESPAIMTMTDAAAPVGRRACMVLMPMLPGFETIRASVARAVQAAGFEMLRLEAEIEDSAWHLWLLDALERAEVALVDLTGHNAYVMYELGCVHQRRLPVSYIVNAGEGQISASVRGCACTPYGDSHVTLEAAVADDLRQLDGAAAGDWQPGDSLLHEADELADAFDRAQGRPFPRVSASVFASRLAVAARRGQPDPRRLVAHSRARFLLAARLAESERVGVMQALGGWCAGHR
jgi:hypothetical protein